MLASSPPLHSLPLCRYNVARHLNSKALRIAIWSVRDNILKQF